MKKELLKVFTMTFTNTYIKELKEEGCWDDEKETNEDGYLIVKLTKDNLEAVVAWLNSKYPYCYIGVIAGECIWDDALGVYAYPGAYVVCDEQGFDYISEEELFRNYKPLYWGATPTYVKFEEFNWEETGIKNKNLAIAYHACVSCYPEAQPFFEKLTNALEKSSGTQGRTSIDLLEGMLGLFFTVLDKGLIYKEWSLIETALRREKPFLF